jgi:hypothetical protein
VLERSEVENTLGENHPWCSNPCWYADFGCFDPQVIGVGERPEIAMLGDDDFFGGIGGVGRIREIMKIR